MFFYHRCKERQRGLSYATFKADLAEQIRLGYIHPEGSPLYINRTWRYEEDASKQLVTILRQPTLPAMAVPENLSVDGIALCRAEGGGGTGSDQQAVADPGRRRLRQEHP